MIIIGAMIFFIVRGIWRGFFKEMGSLAGVILGIWLAVKLQPQLTLFLKSHLSSSRFLSLISFAGIFFVVLVGCNLAGWGLKLLVKKAFLGWADKGLGAALAVLKGIILTYLVIVLLTFFLPAKAPLIAGSRLAPVIVSSYQSLAGFLSPGASDRWKRKKWLGRSGRIDKNTPRKSQSSL
ncbi:MAG: CvpA family protein [Deltaproteobacteria bacterium]|nr:CvpA family protein [Deltaproteobacteria bacterium]